MCFVLCSGSAILVPLLPEASDHVVVTLIVIYCFSAYRMRYAGLIIPSLSDLFLFGRFRLLSAWLPVHAPGM